MVTCTKTEKPPHRLCLWKPEWQDRMHQWLLWCKPAGYSRRPAGCSKKCRLLHFQFQFRDQVLISKDMHGMCSVQDWKLRYYDANGEAYELQANEQHEVCWGTSHDLVNFAKISGAGERKKWTPTATNSFNSLTIQSEQERLDIISNVTLLPKGLSVNVDSFFQSVKFYICGWWGGQEIQSKLAYLLVQVMYIAYQLCNSWKRTQKVQKVANSACTVPATWRQKHYSVACYSISVPGAVYWNCDWAVHVCVWHNFGFVVNCWLVRTLWPWTR